MDMFDLASTLFGNRRDPVAQGSTLTATGSTASADGTAYLVMDADVTPAEGVGDDTDQTVIDVPTSPSVAEGDEVIMTLVGDGPLKTPVVMANPGFGDRMQAQVDNAETLAEQAEAVATATGQHFWPDTDGVHVTEVTQEGWSDSTSPDYHSGANVLLNALGQLFRDGLNNLLAIVTNGIAIYDGNGNEDGNILAKFYTFVLNNHQHARIDFFNGKGFIDYDSNNNELHISARDDSTANVHMNTARINLYQSVDNKISNLEILAGANGAAPPAFIKLDSRNPSGGPFESTIYAYASELLLGYDGDSGSATIPMPQAIAVLSSPVTLFTGTYAQTHSAAVTLSESAANFSRLLFVCENNDGERTSVTVTDPNGKHFNVVMLTIAGPSGTGTYAYMKAKSFSINGTSVTCRTYMYNGQTIYRHGSVTLRNGVAVSATQASEEIGIVKVLGWR